MILYTGIQIIRESTSNLMDTVAGKELAERIYLLLGEIPGVSRSKRSTPIVSESIWLLTLPLDLRAH